MATNISSSLNGMNQSLPSLNTNSSLKNSNMQADHQGTQDSSDKIDFGKLIESSNEEIQKQRQEQKSKDPKQSIFTGQETEEQFFEKLSNQGTPERTEPKNVLNKDDFLKLFITQLSTQDPLKPEDSSEMSARLAQFNSLEQMMNMNTSLNKLIEMQTDNKTKDYLNYIGKEVKLDQGLLNVDPTTSQSRPQKILFSLPQDVTSCQIEILDDQDNVVVNKNVGGCPKGEHSYDWDGLLDNNKQAPNGQYHYRITASDINAQPVKPDVYTKLKITGIDLKDSLSPLLTSIGKIKLEDIISIEDTSINQLPKPQKHVSTTPDKTTPSTEKKDLDRTINTKDSVPVASNEVQNNLAKNQILSNYKKQASIN